MGSRSIKKKKKNLLLVGVEFALDHLAHQLLHLSTVITMIRWTGLAPWEYGDISLICLRPHMRTLWPNVNLAIFQLGRLLMENSRKYTSLSGSLS